MNIKHTPGPWSVRTRKQDGEIVDCFVTAPDVNGFAYAAAILEDDEYRDGIERRLADCNLVAAAPELLQLVIKYRNHGEPNTEPEYSEFIRHVDRVLAQATGEQNGNGTE